MTMPFASQVVAWRTRRRRPGSLVGAALALALTMSSEAALAQAQKPLADRSLEELMDVEIATVYGASRHEQKVSDAPSSVTIVTRDDIRMFGYQTLSQALSSVRGFYLTYDRQYESLGIRGFSRAADYNSRVLLLIDGHRMNDNIYDQASIGTDFPLDIDVVERIEVIRGPGSALYGTSAFFAVVNVVTRKGASLDGVELATTVGSFATWRARATAGHGLSDGGWLVSATSMRSDGPDLYFPEWDSPETNDGRTSGTDSDRLDSVFGSWQRGGLTATVLYGRREKGIPTAPYGTTFNDPRTRSVDTHGYGDIQYRRAAWQDGEFLVRGFFDDYRYEGTWMFDEGAVENRDESIGQWLGGEALASRRAWQRHFLTGGLEVRGNVTQDQLNYDVSPAEVYVDDRRNSMQFAAFVQDEITLPHGLQAIVGARYDRSAFSGSTVEPRVGLVWRPTDRTSIKSLFGTAFRAPTVYEMFYSDASSSQPNPGLKPETLFTYEAIFEHYVRGFRFTAGIYRSSISDLINQFLDDRDGLLQYRNVDDADAWGADVEVEYRAKTGQVARASYAFQHAWDPRTDTTLTNAPRNMAVLSAGTPLWSGRLVVGAEAQYVGARLTRDYDTSAGYWLTRANVVGQLVPGHLDLSLGVGNLFDKRYWHPTSSEQVMKVLEQDGRTMRAGVVVKF